MSTEGKPCLKKNGKKNQKTKTKMKIGAIGKRIQEEAGKRHTTKKMKIGAIGKRVQEEWEEEPEDEDEDEDWASKKSAQQEAGLQSHVPHYMKTAKAE